MVQEIRPNTPPPPKKKYVTCFIRVLALLTLLLALLVQEYDAKTPQKVLVAFKSDADAEFLESELEWVFRVGDFVKGSNSVAKAAAAAAAAVAAAAAATAAQQRSRIVRVRAMKNTRMSRATSAEPRQSKVPQFTCFTATKVQILTPRRSQGRGGSARRAATLMSVTHAM
jgi:hypothetical protein